MSEDLSYKLGTIDTRLRGIETHLNEMRDEVRQDRKDLWKQVSGHGKAIVSLKTKQWGISAAIAAIVSTIVGALRHLFGNHH